ncbi:MAG: Spi family protease inhibitor, partial [Muribaculaceae bacterium]|nr:Spi family protease inhibitor [Muribaculaceae bacterium]
MKKLILFSVLTLMMSCSETDFTPNNQQADSCGRPSKVCRSENEAIQIANDFAESINLSTRSKTRRASSENLGYILDSHSRTTIDTIMYVVHYRDNEGFALIARNPDATPVIAVIDSGQYNPNDISDNQGFNDFIECARAYAITPTDSIYDKPIPVPISYSNSYHIN